MLGLEFFRVPGLAVGHIDLAGLGIVDDVRFQYGDLRHALLRRLDCGRQFVIAPGSFVRFGGEVGIVQQAMLRQIVQRLRHLLEIECLGPPCIPGPLARLELGLNIHQQIYLRRICAADIF